MTDVVQIRNYGVGTVVSIRDIPGRWRITASEDTGRKIVPVENIDTGAVDLISAGSYATTGIPPENRTEFIPEVSEPVAAQPTSNIKKGDIINVDKSLMVNGTQGKTEARVVQETGEGYYTTLSRAEDIARKAQEAGALPYGQPDERGYSALTEDMMANLKTIPITVTQRDQNTYEVSRPDQATTSFYGQEGAKAIKREYNIDVNKGFGLLDSDITGTRLPPGTQEKILSMKTGQIARQVSILEPVLYGKDIEEYNKQQEVLTKSYYEIHPPPKEPTLFGETPTFSQIQTRAERAGYGGVSPILAGVGLFAGTTIITAGQALTGTAQLGFDVLTFKKPVWDVPGEIVGGLLGIEGTLRQAYTERGWTGVAGTAGGLYLGGKIIGKAGGKVLERAGYKGISSNLFFKETFKFDESFLGKIQETGRKTDFQTGKTTSLGVSNIFIPRVRTFFSVIKREDFKTIPAKTIFVVTPKSERISTFTAGVKVLGSDVSILSSGKVNLIKPGIAISKEVGFVIKDITGKSKPVLGLRGKSAIVESAGGGKYTYYTVIEKYGLGQKAVAGRLSEFTDVNLIDRPVYKNIKQAAREKIYSGLSKEVTYKKAKLKWNDLSQTFGKYNSLTGVIEINKKLSPYRARATIIHEFAHSRDLKLNQQFLSGEHISVLKRKIGFENPELRLNYIKQMRQIGSDFRLLDKINKRNAFGFHKQQIYYGYSIGKYASELKARFAQSYPEEILNPTTKTGRIIKEEMLGKNKYRKSLYEHPTIIALKNEAIKMQRVNEILGSPRVKVVRPQIKRPISIEVGTTIFKTAKQYKTPQFFEPLKTKGFESNVGLEGTFLDVGKGSTYTPRSSNYNVGRGGTITITKTPTIISPLQTKNPFVVSTGLASSLASEIIGKQKAPLRTTSAPMFTERKGTTQLVNVGAIKPITQQKTNIISSNRQIISGGLITKSFTIQQSSFKPRTFEQSITSQSSRTTNILGTSGMTSIKTGQSLITNLGQAQSNILRQGTNLRQSTRQTTTTKTTFGFPPMPPITTTSPFFRLPTQEKKRKKLLKKKRGRAGRLFDYQPSTTALIFNIRSKKKPKNVFSGMELRPIFSTSKKKGG